MLKFTSTINDCYLLHISIIQLAYPLLEYINTFCFVISRGADGPGREILQRPPSVRLSVRPSVRPSVRLSVTFSFRTVTQKRIAEISRNFAGTYTMSWGCAV